VASPSIASQVERYRNTVAHGDQQQSDSTKDVHAFFIGITDITNSTSKIITADLSICNLYVTFLLYLYLEFEANNLVGCINQQIVSTSTGRGPKKERAG
jgi:hypothetical protein